MESDFGPVQTLLEFTVPLDTTDHWLVGRASLVSTAWLRLSQQALRSVATAVVGRLDTNGGVMKPRDETRRSGRGDLRGAAQAAAHLAVRQFDGS